jgi:hypothetical protein
MSREYILLSIFERKTAFLTIYKPNRAQNRPFFTVFVHSGQHGGVFDSFNSLHHHPCPGTPPANSRRTKQFLSRPHSL